MTGQIPLDAARLDPARQLDSTAARSPLSPGQETAGGEGPSFAEILESSIKEVNDLKKDADEAIQELAQGKTENVSEVLTAVEKADLAFRALMSIRNKLVDAYEEINRLRV